MLEVFSPNAREAMALARMEANYFNDDFIGPEHLLIALIEVRACSGSAFLKERDVVAEVTRYELRQLGGRSVGRESDRHVPYARNVKRVLEIAIESAVEAGEHYIGTNHILMGLLTAENSIAVDLLEAMNVDVRSLATDLTVEIGKFDGKGGEDGGEPHVPSILGKLVYESFKEVERLDDDELRPEHLLLAILGFKHKRFLKIIAALDLNYEKVLDMVREVREEG
ncbi:MAG: Clp protease N-terminal domain-containing protein [Planctomycetota bacterium]|jgi:ATP-dependent Clp protease ATP-binding subunit ClpC